MEMEFILWGILILFLLFIITVLGILIYSGILYNVVVGAGKPPIGSVTVAYKFQKGPYKNAGYLFNEVSSIAPKLKCFGCYYDNPNEVPPEDQRYIVGSILRESDAIPDEALLNDFKKFGFKTIDFPAVTHAVTTTFPYNTMLSIFIGISRVYPKLISYLKEKHLCAHPFLEIYDGFTIHFMAPLAKQDEFYVPEAKPEEDIEDESEITDEDASGITEQSREDKYNIDLQDSVSPVGSDGKSGIIQDPESVLEDIPHKDSRSSSTGSSFEEVHEDEISQ